ncbi:hypothetical protein [Streptomyces sp. A1136]|uniref:hypothetical protein n=1 Tax=Streptomyces sp. A1136 TaxID=2563102 RepID=UPI001F0E5970|nr:hypothetical protein [Streptomyces sp. A1136]
MTVRCAACGRESDWPHPEVGCASCGTVVLIPVHEPGPPRAVAGPRDGVAAEDGLRPEGGAPGSGPTARREPGRGPGAVRGRVPGTGPSPGPEQDPGQGQDGAARTGPSQSRPPFRPVTIRTARDAVATAALYLRWLGFRDVRQPDGPPIPSATVDLRAPGVVAQVDPSTAPAGLRAVECVWLNGLTASATSVYFSLAGYTSDARARADDLGIPLFVMDLTGMPQPVNDPADALVGTGP